MQGLKPRFFRLD